MKNQETKTDLKRNLKGLCLFEPIDAIILPLSHKPLKWKRKAQDQL